MLRRTSACRRPSGSPSSPPMRSRRRVHHTGDPPHPRTRAGIVAIGYLGPISLLVDRTAGHRRVQLPTDDRRLSEWRRLLHREQAQPRDPGPGWSPAPPCSSTTPSPWRCRSPAARPRSSAIREPLRGHPVATAVVLLALLTEPVYANLRGVRGSVQAAARRDVGYIAIMTVFIVYGLARTVLGDLGPLPPDEEALAAATDDGAARRHRLPLPPHITAFSSGAIALSGVEAISNGVPAFKAAVAQHGHHPHLDRRHPRSSVHGCGHAGPAAPGRPSSEDQDDPFDHGQCRGPRASATCCCRAPFHRGHPTSCRPTPPLHRTFRACRR